MPAAGIKPGNVPTARIGPILDSLIRERWPYGGGHEILAEKVGCEQSTIATIIEQQWEGVEFDLADSLLCALGRWDMWHGALEDIYPTKFWSTCSLPVCNKRFPEGGRGRPKRYCSSRCRNLHRQARNPARKETGERLRKRGYCLKGHRLTGENVKPQANGKVRCAICNRERNRIWARERRAARSPEWWEQQRAYHRAKYRERKAARAA